MGNKNFKLTRPEKPRKVKWETSVISDLVYAEPASTIYLIRDDGHVRNGFHVVTCTTPTVAKHLPFVRWMARACAEYEKRHKSRFD
jgi:hypothetical protein